MKIKVLSYSPELDVHTCHNFDYPGNRLRLDLMTSGAFPEDTTPESLVGKVYEIEYTHPFIEMAEGVNPTPLE